MQLSPTHENDKQRAVSLFAAPAIMEPRRSKSGRTQVAEVPGCMSNGRGCSSLLALLLRRGLYHVKET
jgi:hypothetical protein